MAARTSPHGVAPAVSVVESRSMAEPAASLQARMLALSWLNFFLSGMQTAFGPIAAAYLALQGWTAKDIGFVLTIGSTTSSSVRSLAASSWIRCGRNDCWSRPVWGDCRLESCDSPPLAQLPAGRLRGNIARITGGVPCAALFQLASASMMPLFSGILAYEGKGRAAPLIAVLIGVPQVLVGP